MDADGSQWAVENRMAMSRDSRDSRDVSVPSFFGWEKTPPPVYPPVILTLFASALIATESRLI